jgi:hypothetical protein
MGGVSKFINWFLQNLEVISVESTPLLMVMWGIKVEAVHDYCQVGKLNYVALHANDQSAGAS